jgi:hypothetical protein
MPAEGAATTFFDDLAAGQNKADALRSKHPAPTKGRRDKYAPAHPFYRAALTLPGR